MADPVPTVPILMYHRIGMPPRGSIVRNHYVSSKQFSRHVRALCRWGFRTLSLSSMCDGFANPRVMPSKPIVITFDDAYESFFTDAMPTLAAAGMTATVFAVAGCVGGENDWDLAKGDVAERLMSADQLRKARSDGFEVGSHSMTHPDLTQLAGSELDRQVMESRNVLSEIAEVPIEWFCYPYGANDLGVRSAVKNAGYAGACATGKFGNVATTDRFALKRLNVRATTSTLQLALKIRSALRKPG